jgi:hypothetical protein
VYNEQTVNPCAFCDSISVCCSKRAEKEFTLLIPSYFLNLSPIMSDLGKETSTHHFGNSNSTTTHNETLAPPIEDDRRRTSVAGQPAYTEKGPLINHEIPQADVVQQEPDLAWSRIRRYFREPLAEFFGVFILILFGDGVVAQVVLSGGKNGDYQSISWGWG